VFKRLKESKNMMESREESSGSNKLGWNALKQFSMTLFLCF
jgi:hypothetical protein